MVAKASATRIEVNQATGAMGKHFREIQARNLTKHCATSYASFAHVPKASVSFTLVQVPIYATYGYGPRDWIWFLLSFGVERTIERD
jgi:hypothetical protein